MSDSNLRDVMIAGAGPVGLFLACELALAGLDVLVVEQAADPHAPLKEPPLGVRSLSVATVEALYRRGLLEDVLAAASAAPARTAGPGGSDAGTRPATTQAGHFAGIPIDRALVDPTSWSYHVPNPASANLAVDMASLETVLAARADALGVDIRRGVAVTACSDDGHQVLVQAGALTMRARWLVGCDGGRSTVRKLAGFAFTGTEPTFTAYYALVDLAGPDQLRPGRHATPSGFYMHTPGQIAIADFDDGAFDRASVITRAHLQAVLRRVSATDVTIGAVRLATSFTDRARIATHYRRGRILLAGDAAHIHSALGGQGLNAGLGDAMNLGWKLAATVLGTAPATLLDTYHAERHPVGNWVLEWTRAQAALMHPTPQDRAMANIVRDLAATRDGATYFAGQLWGTTLRYDLGENHPLVGCSAPDLVFSDGRRLAEHLCDGMALLIDLAEGEPLRAVAEGWRDRIRYLPGAARDGLGLRALLVRPDGFVAWASDTETEPDDMAHAATRWFGAPCPLSLI